MVERHPCDLVSKSKRLCDHALVDREEKIKNMTEEIMFSEQAASEHLHLEFSAMTSTM